jgi:hypothetical protein
MVEFPRREPSTAPLVVVPGQGLKLRRFEGVGALRGKMLGGGTGVERRIRGGHSSSWILTPNLERKPRLSLVFIREGIISLSMRHTFP